MLRFIAPLLALLLCLPAHADSFITRALDKPVPGGVAVIDLGTGAQAPTATYQGKPVLVVKEQGTRWLAIVGIPLTVKPGTQQVTSGGRTLNFKSAASNTRNSTSPSRTSVRSTPTLKTISGSRANWPSRSAPTAVSVPARRAI